MAKVILRDVFTISPRNPLVFDDPSLTDQSQASSCDLQTIIDWHARSGSWVMPNQKLRPEAPTFEDVSAYANVDYQDAYNMVVKAEEAFMTLPAAVRARFANDPAGIFEFLQDPTNRDEAVQLGLIAASVEPVVSKVDNPTE